MAIDPSLILRTGQVPNVGNIFKSVLSNVDSLDKLKQNRLLAPLREEMLEAQIAQQKAATLALQEGTAAGKDIRMTKADEARVKSIVQGANEILPFLQNGDDLGALDSLTARKARLEQQGLPTQDTDEAIELLQTNPSLLQQRVQQVVTRGQQLNLGGASTSTRTRQQLLRDAASNDPVKSNSALVELGLKGKATGAAPQIVDVGGVPHIFDKQNNKLVRAEVEGQAITPESIADSKAIIREREKFGELKGNSRAKAIDKGFESIAAIDKNTRNLDKAIKALSEGANTGAITRFFPSIKASTRILNRVQNELALDVIGSVTFGALSQGELDLAKDTALDTGLSEEALLLDLQDRKIAQGKLRAYFNEQIQFLDQGGSVAGFLRMKEREQGSKSTGQSQSSGFKIISVD